MKKNNRIIIALVLIILAGAALSGYLIRGNKLAEFKNKGIETTATITNLNKDRAYRVSSKGQKHRSEYSIKVTYFTENAAEDSIKNKKTISKDENGNYKLNLDKFNNKIGEFVMTEIDVSASQFKRLKKGQKIQIIYLADNIEKAILKEDIE